MQLWHGTADETLSFNNFGEEIKQWTNVLGVSETPTTTEQNTPQSGFVRTRYIDASGIVRVEAVREDGQPHNLVVRADEVIRFFGLDGSIDPSDVGGGGSGGSGGSSGTGGSPNTAGTAGSSGVSGGGTGGAAPSGTGGAAANGGGVSTGGAANAGGGVSTGGATNTGGTVTIGDDGSPPPMDDGGCSCRVGAPTRHLPESFVLAVGMLVLLRARRLQRFCLALRW
jgi:hypothetical protein